MPLVNPVTVHVVAGALTVHVRPSGEDVNVYEVIAGPPVFTGAVKEMLAEPSPRVTTNPVGASGLTAGVTLEEITALDVAVELTATAENVYPVPLTSEDIAHELDGALIVQLPPEGDDVIVNDVAVPPPVPALIVTVAPLSVAATEVNVGATGAATFHCAISVVLVEPMVVE